MRYDGEGRGEGVGHGLRDIGEVGRLVAAAAVRRRREVGGVGFQQNPMKPDFGQLGREGGVFEGDDAVDAK